MLTGKSELHIYKANQEKAPLIISGLETSEKLWQNHTNYFSVLWIQDGKGTIETDFSKANYNANSIYCFNNYQAFALMPRQHTKALLLLFHPNFFCIETYQHEVGCNGVLFNQVYDASPISVTAKEGDELLHLLDNIQQEAGLNDIATGELVFSYLKILLVKLTRLKTIQAPEISSLKTTNTHLEQLIALINENFAKEHSPSFYAGKLHVSVKTLSNNCRLYFKKSISALINEKILLKAKWELLHTDSQVKLIADNLGFKDEYYFSRFFKKHIGVSPRNFREAEWEMRKGYLSIP